MKKTLWTLLLVFGLSGCSTVQVSDDYDTGTDFSQLKTYDWLPAGDQVKPTAEEFEKKNPLIAERIQKAILANMNAKGYQFVSEKPNAYITYHVGVSSKIRSTPVTTSIGFGTGFYGGYGGLGVQTGSDIEEYQQGKVVLDILDSNKKLVWRGISTSDVDQHAEPKEITEQVNEIVQKLLAQYPPKKAK
jgi:hypothetical protein